MISLVFFVQGLALDHVAVIMNISTSFHTWLPSGADSVIELPCPWICVWFSVWVTLSHSCLKVHAGVPIALIISFVPLVLRINCLVIRELLTVLFLNPESSILKP